MPPLTGFSDNPFLTRDDVLRAAKSLLEPLQKHKSPCGARIKLPIATGTGFDEISAQLEGFARPLWIVADLLSSRLNNLGPESRFEDLGLNSWIRGLYTGVDPESTSFWGFPGNHDQRMVEMEPIAYALLSAPSVFSLGTSEEDKKNTSNLKVWLSSINERVMPPSNWRWFRVLVNLALINFFGVPHQEVKPIMDADFEVLDSCYIGEGWSSDGVWSDDKKQVDYYSGSFAIQYSQLAYVRFAADLDPERVERYRQQAREFSLSFWRYFDVHGAAIPFGRSLTYRFTFAAFWSAAVVVGVELPAPVNSLGVVKGLLFRHLRWWANHPDFFNADGTLSIGYTYPNMYLSEDYNSPQSTYWCLKTLAVLGSPPDHPFWTCEELAHPLTNTYEAALALSPAQSNDWKSNYIGVISPAMHIICSPPEHHFLLSSGQFTKKPHKAREAKYGKFVYSSAFGFSVPTGTTLEQMAPDSTLSISEDEGETWKVRWNLLNAQIQKMKIVSNDGFGVNGREISIPILTSSWIPWRNSGLTIQSILVPTSTRWPGWHVRIHKLQWPSKEAVTFECVDAGFAIAGETSRGAVLPTLVVDGDVSFPTEGILEDARGCLILSAAGACGAVNLCAAKDSSNSIISKGSILKPDANTNLIAQRTLIPTVRHQISFQPASPNSQNTAETEVLFATGIFAVSSSAGLDHNTILSMWNKKPVVQFVNANGKTLKLGTGEEAENWEIKGLWKNDA